MGSKSKTSSKSSTTNSDNRTVAEADSIALVGTAAGGNINITDGGLVDAALKYLDAADQRNTDRLSVLVEAGAGVLAANQANTNAVLARASQQDTPETMQFSQTAMIGAGALLLVAVLVIGRK